MFIPLPIPTDALEHQIVCKVDGILCGLVNKQLLSTYTFTIQIVVLFCLSSKLQQPHGKHASSSYVDILKTIAILPCAVSCGLIQIYFVRSINKCVWFWILSLDHTKDIWMMGLIIHHIYKRCNWLPRMWSIDYKGIKYTPMFLSRGMNQVTGYSTPFYFSAWLQENIKNMNICKV